MQTIYKTSTGTRFFQCSAGAWLCKAIDKLFENSTIVKLIAATLIISLHLRESAKLVLAAMY